MVIDKIIVQYQIEDFEKDNTKIAIDFTTNRNSFNQREIFIFKYISKI